MNNKILKKYQERLNDISRRNRAIRLSRIVKKKCFDMTDLSKISEKKDLKILDNLFFNKKSSHLISLNVKNKEEERILKDLTYLYRDLDFLLKERGFYECFLGYPFIEGNFSDGSFFRAPLFLLPVKLVLNRVSKRISLEVRDGAKMEINKTFFMALNKYNKGRNSIQLDLLKEVEDLPKDKLIDWAKNIFKKSGFEIISNELEEGKLIKLKPLKKEEHPKNLEGKIEFKPIFILGQFGQMGSAINNDYSALINDGLQNKLSERILGEETERDLEKRFDEDAIVDSLELDNFFITKPDISQEESLINSRKGNGLVIHGPPGTGKSQVITNLIADNLQRGKKILLVCEKRPALDVVKNRLASKGIHKNCILVHDYNNERNPILNQMASVLEEYDIHDDSRYGERANGLKKNIKYKSEEIDLKITEIRNLINLFHDHKKRGIPLYKLYQLSKKEQDTSLDIAKIDDSKINFRELQKISEKLSTLSDGFYKFESEKFPLINRKKFDTDFDELEFKERINNLIKNFENFEKYFYRKEFKIDVKAISNKRDVSFDELEEVVDEIKEFDILNKVGFSKIINKRWWKLKKIYLELMSTQDNKNILNRWNKLKPILKNIKNDFRYLSKIFKEEEMSKLKKNIFSFKTNLDFFKKIKTVYSDLEDLILFDSSFLELEEFEKQILKECYRKIPLDNNMAKTWEITIKQSFYLKWINEFEKTHPKIKEFSNDFYNKKIKELNKLIDNKIELIPSLIKETLFSNYVNLKWKHYDYDGRRVNYNNLKNLIHEVNKKRRKLTIRELLSLFWEDGISQIFPCWMCSPETVSAIFPMKKDIFDIIIFDEASQTKLEKSIPTIFRGKKLIVAGDEKQLPPTTFFMSGREEIEEDEDYGYDEKQLIENESLLEQAKLILPGKRLIYHYRSHHEELIDFSNYAFYENTLRNLPKNLTKKNPPIEFENVKGIWESGINKKEAKIVVKKIKEFLTKRKNSSTIGVITFNSKQRDLIKDFLDEEAKQDPHFGSLLDKEYSRHDGEEYNGLFVKNIENVQGDERDVIIFSVAYGYDKSNKFRYHFGPLNGPYGPNRLNVAISRAREKIIVYSSFEPSDLKYAGAYEGPKLLRNYLKYCKLISENKKELAYDLLETYVGNDDQIDVPEFEEYDSDFEGEVRDALVKLGYKVKTQVGSKGYKIDLAIVHPKDKKTFLAGIECDGAKYHSSPSAKERDLYRQKILEDNGWNILRVWSRDWWKNEEKVMAILDMELKKLLLKS